MHANRKYYTRVFGYEGTDLIESMKREVREINEIIKVIRNEDDEKVFITETRLFNGVIDDNKELEEEPKILGIVEVKKP